MADALWELAPPIFLGTLLAVVVLTFLMGKQRTLLRGPRALAHALFRPRHCGCQACSQARAPRSSPPPRRRAGGCAERYCAPKVK